MTPRYQEFAADPALAAHVQCRWLFEGNEDGGEQAIPPDGRAELIVHRGRPYEERASQSYKARRAGAPMLQRTARRKRIAHADRHPPPRRRRGARRAKHRPRLARR
jgi:hypothetical protein